MNSQKVVTNESHLYEGAAPAYLYRNLRKVSQIYFQKKAPMNKPREMSIENFHPWRDFDSADLNYFGKQKELITFKLDSFEFIFYLTSTAQR